MTSVPDFNLTVGMDLGDRWCQLAVLDGDGELTEETRVQTTAKAIHKWFERIDPSRVALEVGTHSPWISRLLQELGHDVIVANPRKVRMIYASTNKSDRFDAQALARLARLDPELLSGFRHRGEQAQEDLAVIQARELLVRTRTRLTNHIRGAVKSVGGRIPRCSAATFHRKAPGGLPAGLKEALLPLVEHLESVTGEIRRYDYRIKVLTTERYPETELLRQVPGVGPITSLALPCADPPRGRRRGRVSGGLPAPTRPFRHSLLYPNITRRYSTSQSSPRFERLHRS